MNFFVFLVKYLLNLILINVYFYLNAFILIIPRFNFFPEYKKSNNNHFSFFLDMEYDQIILTDLNK